MRRVQLIFVALGALTWLIGGNVLVARHRRRHGLPPWPGNRLFAFPFKNFNAKEWFALAILMVVSLTLMGIAISMSEK